jgi:hypothetical protein
MDSTFCLCEVPVSDTPMAQRLLALFTSPECAEAIAGDFVEARGDRGSAWFWRQVLATSASLGAHALTSAPLTSAMVLAAGCALFGSMAFAGFAPVAMFPALLGTPASWVVLSVAWWSSACFTGFTLVHLSPTRGMAASVVLAVVGELLVIALRATVDGDILASPSAVIYSIAMLTAVPLVAGSAFARRRIIATRTEAHAR